MMPVRPYDPVGILVFVLLIVLANISIKAEYVVDGCSNMKFVVFYTDFSNEMFHVVRVSDSAVRRVRCSGYSALSEHRPPSSRTPPQQQTRGLCSSTLVIRWKHKRKSKAGKGESSAFDPFALAINVSPDLHGELWPLFMFTGRGNTGSWSKCLPEFERCREPPPPGFSPQFPIMPSFHSRLALWRSFPPFLPVSCWTVYPPALFSWLSTPHENV